MAARYDQPKSKRRSKQANPVAGERADVQGRSRSASNQERATGSASGKRVKVAVSPASGNVYMSKNADAGNQVRIAVNDKGTGRLKEPSAIGSASRDRLYVDPFAVRAAAGKPRNRK